jgi:hypothetical protein
MQIFPFQLHHPSRDLYAILMKAARLNLPTLIVHPEDSSTRKVMLHWY